MKITLAQLRCSLYEKQANLLRILKTIESKSKDDINYIIFPELFLTGYVMDHRVLDLAETVEGASIKAIQAAVKMYAVGVIIGFPERENENIYNTALIIGKDGKILGKYRKVHLYYQEKKYFTAGNSLPVFDLPEGRIGLGITYDMEFPETARTLALNNAQLFIVLAANMVPYQEFQNVFIKARALENHIYTAVINMVGLDNENVFFGESHLVHPSGKTIYQAKNNEETPTFSISLDESIQEKAMLDYLHNRNVSTYNLS